MSLAERLSHIRRRITQACLHCGRDPHAVQLVCVTKTVPIEVIRQVIALGVTEIGENRVQEAHVKQRTLGLMRNGEWGMRNEIQRHSEFRIPNSEFGLVRWHLVGHLQRNKAKDAVELFDVIHSVDSLALAEELERHAAKKAQGSPRAEHSTPCPPPVSRGRRGCEARLEAQGENLQQIEVFIQVNVSGEATKFGCPPEEAETLARVVLGCQHLRLVGFMTIPPLSDDPEAVRPHFRRLRALRDDLTSHFPLPTSHFQLSMGMSHDFEVAIEEGADVVRIGTAIFGDRRQETGDRRL